jgi:hypothetical protein
MGGLADFGRAAGGFSEGFNRSLDQQQQRRYNDQRMSLADLDMKRQQRRAEQEDADYKAEQEANQAGIAALEARRQQHEAEAAAGGLAGAQPGAAPTPWQPKPTDLLAAEQAAYDKLYKSGRYNAFNKRYAQAEAMRGQLRAKTGQNVLATLQTGGDITGALREHDSLMDDGTELLEAMPIKSKDGQPAYRLRRKNRLTGEALPESDVTAEQLGQMVTTSMADPKAVATYNFQAYKQAAKDKAAEERAISNKAADHQRALEVAGVYAGSREKVAQTSAQSRITVSQLRGAGGGRGLSGGTGNNVARVMNNDDGTRTIIFRNGDNKLLTDDNGKPLRGIEAEKLVNSVAGQVSKTIEGSLASPEANRARAQKMLPQAPSGPPAGMPAGSKQIGTSGGKPVYESPDGKRFIVE